MRLFPYTFDEFALNNQRDIYAWFVDPHMWSLSSATVGLVKRSGDFPAFGSVQFSERNFSMKIVLKNAPAYRNTLSARINTADKVRKTLKQLVAFDEDSGKFLYLECYPVSLVCDDDVGKQFTATFVAPDPEWKSVRTYTSTKHLTGSGQTLTITAGGNVPTEPTIKITPAIQKATGYPYRQFFTVRNNATFVAGRSAGAWTNRPIDITDGGLATAALVAGGKMRQDGNDVRVFVNKVEVNRWFNVADLSNPGTTKIWVNLNELPYQALQSNTTVLLAGTVATIAIKSPKVGTKYKLTNYPKQGVLQLGSEQFYYNGIDVRNGVFTIQERAARGTAADAHAIGDALYVMTNDIMILYGEASAEAPTVDDGYKPMIDLTQSTNAVWYWDSTSHFASDEFPNRTAKWSYTNTANYVESGIYTLIHVGDADPFEVMGTAIQPHLKGTKWYAGDVNTSWIFSDPVGVSEVDAGGEYYKYVTNSLWPVIKLFKEKTVVYTITTPLVYDSWLVWTQHAIALGNTYYKLSFVVDGACAPIVNNLIAFEVNDVFVTFSNTRKPTVTRSAELTSTYSIAMTFSRTAAYEGTSVTESLTVNIPTVLNQAVIINTATREVYKESDKLNAIPAVEKDNERMMWLPLYPGDNVITFTETGLVNVDVEFSYQEKYN